MTLVPLSVPIILGLLDITRILYPLPPGNPDGIVAGILPELEVLANVPIEVGDEKEPLASDN